MSFIRTVPHDLRGVVKALSFLGIEGEFEPPNDVTVNGRKISGSARIRRT